MTTLITLVFHYNEEKATKKTIKHDFRKIVKKTSSIKYNVFGSDEVYLFEFDTVKAAQRFVDRVESIMESNKQFGKGLCMRQVCFDDFWGNSIDEIIKLQKSVHEEMVENYIIHHDGFTCAEDEFDEYRPKDKEGNIDWDAPYSPPEEAIRACFSKVGLPHKYLNNYIKLCQINGYLP
jgi:hypothetical protein